MPTVLWQAGFRLFFFSNEGSPREPAHAHVKVGGSEAKFWIRPVRLAANKGLSARQLLDAQQIVQANEALIERMWNEHFS